MQTTTTRRGLLTAAALGGAAATLGAHTTESTAYAASGATGGGTLREYWIAAEPFHHVLSPTGVDAMTGARIDRRECTLTALRYRAYTANWGKPLPPSAGLGPNTGMPGPTLRASVGDTIRVHFRNDDHHYKMRHGMHPHGVYYTPAGDGSQIWSDHATKGSVLPGEAYTYEWEVRASSVGTWPYHDHSMSPPIAGPGKPAGGGMMSASDLQMEIGAELGLFGIIAITDENTPAVDRELILFFHDMYAADIPAFHRDWDCFNGGAYLGNTPTFRAKVGERIRWRIAALGTEFHVFHTHGHRWQLADGSFTDSQILGPSTTLTVEWTEDNPGTWLYHCHVVDHMMGGMIGHYVVD